jgi:hypothetical protein
VRKKGSSPKTKPSRKRGPETAVAPPVSKDESVELRTEKIKNGFIVTKSTYKNGKYETEKMFYDKAPKMEISCESPKK